MAPLVPAGSRRELVVDHLKSKYFIGSVVCLLAAMVAMLAALALALVVRRAVPAALLAALMAPR